jgi:predicted neuraminidase
MKTTFYARHILAVAGIALIVPAVMAATDRQPGLIKQEFIFEQVAFAASHSSTIVETQNGVLAAWFAGSEPRHPDVSIWSARYDGTSWSAPIEVVNGLQENGERFQCWNPVLFQPSRGPLLLFYKVGPKPEGWWGMLITSTNAGRTWSKPVRLPDGFVGPVRNKPVELPDGSLLCGASTEGDGWVVHIERAFQLGQRWEKTGPLNEPSALGTIQPTILLHSPQNIQILCRTKQGTVAESWSKDVGQTWSPMARASLPNPNSAIDAVRLKDGRSLLVYNHSATNRNVLNVAVSKDGKQWQAALVLENQPGEFSYPAVIQSRDGLVHITYSWNRQRIKHAVVDPVRLRLTPITEER